jgi:hypothetical protein
VSPQRVAFLKDLLELNGFQVVVAPSPPPKPPATAVPAAVEGVAAVPDLLEPLPETYSLGVTDLGFNTINAIFGRLLKTRNQRVVTLAYWQQKDPDSRDQVPYFQL